MLMQGITILPLNEDRVAIQQRHDNGGARVTNIFSPRRPPIREPHDILSHFQELTLKGTPGVERLFGKITHIGSSWAKQSDRFNGSDREPWKNMTANARRRFHIDTGFSFGHVRTNLTITWTISRGIAHRNLKSPSLKEQRTVLFLGRSIPRQPQV
jgi:hypothetical protein